MVRKKIVKVFSWSILAALILLPLFLLRNYISLFYKLYKKDYSSLKSTDGVTSVLILGKGGVGHEAPDLTDTIIDVFINQSNSKITMLSLPRDIWVPEIRAKLNSSYYWDKERENKDLLFTKTAVEKITGVKPDYVLVVDFSIFKDLIDSLQGIEVDVQNAFMDEKFPITGKENDLCNGDYTYSCRYETILFKKGVQVMDGDTALKFVRSRNSEGDEGTDLAREARQQLVITAIKNKITASPKLALDSIGSALSNIETDIDFNTAIILAKMMFDSKDNIQNITIPEDYFLISQNNYKYDYLYVLLPKGGSWSDFQTWFTMSPNQIY